MSFSSDLKRFAEKTETKLDDVVRKTCISLSTNVIMGTPVKSGRARGGWIADIDKMSEGDGKPDKSGARTVQKATTVANGSAGKKFFLVNNVVYIRRLEYEGWSAQAPDGMVRISVEQFEKWIKEANE